MMQRHHSLKIKLISITRLVGRGSLEIYLTKTNLIKNAELGEGLQTVCLFRVPFISSDYQMTGICKRR